jgi:hypothetical protein
MQVEFAVGSNKRCGELMDEKQYLEFCDNLGKNNEIRIGGYTNVFEGGMERELEKIKSYFYSVRDSLVKSHPLDHSIEIYNIIVDRIKKENPAFYNKCYPKPFQHADKWYSARYFSLIAQESMFQRAMGFKQPVSDNGNIDSVALSVYYTTSRLLELGVPTYFVEPALLQALSQTNLPKELTLTDIHWPFDAILFVLPKNCIKAPHGEPLYLGIARNPAGHQTVGFKDKDSISTSVDTLTTFAFLTGEQMYGFSHPINETYVIQAENAPDLDYFVPFEIPLEDAPETISIEFRKQDLPDADKVFSRLAIKLALQLLLVTAARPELIELERVLRPAKMSKGVQKKGLFKPHILGFKYKLKYEHSIIGGHHESPINHWRAGHWRLYSPRPGVKWKKENQIWIEPTFVIGKP